MASSLIQASWKMHKNRQYLEFHKKNQTEDNESSMSLHEENCMYQEHIESSFKNKVWMWKKVKREIKLMEAALHKEVISEHVGQTLEEYSTKVKNLERLSKKACFVMPYPADSEDWEAFWEQLGKPVEVIRAKPMVSKFRKAGLGMMMASSMGFKSKPKPMRKPMTRRMSTAGFRQLQNRASRLSLSQESFVKTNKKLHKNKKIRKKQGPQFDAIEEDNDMQTLTEDAELEAVAEIITQKSNKITEASKNQSEQVHESHQNKRDSSLNLNTENQRTSGKRDGVEGIKEERGGEITEDKKAQLEKIQQLLKTVQDMLENN